ncbi:MAG: HAMP domain-containing sensor histidine kinase, partial [Pseudomonadota bacterium]
MTRGRLRILLVLFFAALVIPTSILVYQAYGQLKWEAFHQHQQLAREVTLRIDAQFEELIDREEKRATSDYEFLNVAGGDESAFLQRSPLSELPSDSDLPGLLGYFQVDGSGRLDTPILPQDNAASYGISTSELLQREQQAGRIREVLEQNRLSEKSDNAAAPAVRIAEAEAPIPASPDLDAELDDVAQGFTADDESNQGQSLFDALSSRKLSSSSDTAVSRQIKDLKLEDSFEVAASAEEKPLESRSKQKLEKKRSRKEQVNLPQTLLQQSQAASSSADESALAETASVINQQLIRIETFESEVDPMEFAQLDSGHFVLYRRVWHKSERYVQDILFDQDRFLNQMVSPAFRQSSLSGMSQLIVAYQGGILQNFKPEYRSRYQPGTHQNVDELLYQSRLVAPFGDLELIYTLARLPIGAGGQIILWSALVLTIVLVGGCLMLYRLGLRQLALAQQQQDFVSAVSHELKTPLTSIRMYGEMLREGWADKEKQKTYYDFIFHEAERLTRLINNVLQLARMSRNDQAAQLSRHSVKALVTELKPRLTSQMEASGFELNLEIDDAVSEVEIQVDSDWLLQILINLVDNAIKFS